MFFGVYKFHGSKHNLPISIHSSIQHTGTSVEQPTTGQALVDSLKVIPLGYAESIEGNRLMSQ